MKFFQCRKINAKALGGDKNSAGVLYFKLYENLHGLRTPNERMNQRNLKFWADVADKICFDRT